MPKRMGFKELLQQDVKNVFLNPAEFGETHTVNDKEMVIVIDDHELLERQIQGQYADGIYMKRKLAYVPAADFGPLPAKGSLFMIDEEGYIVVEAIAEGDIYAVTIEANEGR